MLAMSKSVSAGDPVSGGVREGRIGLVARTAGGEFVAVTARRVFEESFSRGHDRLAAEDLLTAFPVAAGLGGQRQPRSILRPSACFGEAVFRHVSQGTRAPGRVSALYGAVSVMNNNAPLRIHGLIEVSFTPVTHRSRDSVDMPPIAERELGSLVMTYEGAAVGLIVGGGGHVAVVAPLDGLFARRELVLEASEFKPGAFEIGMDFVYNDLNQTERLDFGEIPKAA